MSRKSKANWNTILSPSQIYYQAIYSHSCQQHYGHGDHLQTALCDDASEPQQMSQEAGNWALKKHMPEVDKQRNGKLRGLTKSNKIMTK